MSTRLFPVVLLTIFLVGTNISTLGQQRSKFDYSRYETEDMDPYRSVIEFVYPDMDLGGISNSAESDLPDMALIDVSQFFSDTTVVYIDSDPNIQGLVDRHKYLNSRIRTTNGWRIQIIATSNRKLATNYQYQFEARYPHQAYMTYESPNYKIRIGDFLKQNDAELFRGEISSSYPDAFLVSERVRVPKYKGPSLRR